MAKTDSWLKDHITHVQGLLWSGASIAIILIVLFKDVKAEEKLVYLIMGMVNAVIGYIFGYYMGATKMGNERLRAEIESKSLEQVNTVTETHEVKKSPSSAISMPTPLTQEPKVTLTPQQKEALNDDEKATLLGLGYTEQEIAVMKIDDALETIKDQVKKIT